MTYCNGFPAYRQAGRLRGNDREEAGMTEGEK